MTLMESLRVRIGLADDDTSRDAEITLVKDTAFAMMGNYCDHTFPLKIDAEEVFTHLTGESIQVKRYPINSITSIVDDKGQAVTQFHTELETGVIYLDSPGVFHQATVTFSGGYDEDALPPDLLMAFYAVFDQEWDYAEGEPVTSSGEISSVTVQDVGTVRYQNSSSEGLAGEGGFLPDRAKSLLEPYMRFKC